MTEGYHEKRANDWLVEDGTLEDRRIHHHVVINATDVDDLEEIRSLWQGGGYIRAEPLDVHYYRELAKYMTKEAREFGRPKPGERTWRCSRNLRRPEIEYIEIPSDSVTLTPPYGAVDYELLRAQSIRIRGLHRGALSYVSCEGAGRIYLYTAQAAETAAHLIIFCLETSLNNSSMVEKRRKRP